MKSKNILIILFVIFLFTNCENLEDIKNVSFKNDITPILNEYCVECHSSNHASGNLNFESYEKLMSSRYFNRNTPVALAGDSKVSRLYLVVHSEKSSIMMPPPTSGKDRLTNEEITKIKVWIDEGANNN